MVKIVLSKVAKLDLTEIFDFIKQDSYRYAVLEKSKIINAIDKLALQPFLGKPFPELINVREMIFENYRIIYENVSERKSIS